MTNRLLNCGNSDQIGAIETGDLIFSLVSVFENARFDVESDRENARKLIAKISSLLGLDLLSSPCPIPRLGKNSGLAQWQVLRLQKIIDSRVDQKVSISDLSGIVHLSNSRFARAFKISFGETPHNYVLRRRVAHAKRLLVSTTMPLHEIALNCGFSDQAHFCKVFRRIVAETPATWRRYRQEVISSAYEKFPMSIP